MFLRDRASVAVPIYDSRHGSACSHVIAASLTNADRCDKGPRRDSSSLKLNCPARSLLVYLAVAYFVEAVEKVAQAIGL